MAGLLDPVSAELRLWASAPFIDGETDCALSVLAYVERVTGRQLSPRPRYAGKLGGERFLRRRGGFEAYGTWAMAQLGCPRTDAPQRGDVGLIDLPGSGVAACLCLGPAPAVTGAMWAARAHYETVIAPMTALAAWRVFPGGVPCPRP